jgi:hypothetical protein
MREDFRIRILFDWEEDIQDILCHCSIVEAISLIHKLHKTKGFVFANLWREEPLQHVGQYYGQQSQLVCV